MGFIDPIHKGIISELNLKKDEKGNVWSCWQTNKNITANIIDAQIYFNFKTFKR